MLKESADEYLTKIINWKDDMDRNTLTSIFVLAVTFLISIQFLRYVWHFFYPSQPIEDLLHFKAAPAGYCIIMFFIKLLFVYHVIFSDRAAVISIQGQRKYMEDTYQAIPQLNGHSDWSFYGVYDGHGGARCSVYVAHYLHKHVLAWIDAYIAHYSSNSKLLSNTDDDKTNNDNDEQDTNNDIPACILKIMNEILLKSHRKADQEFLQLANRQKWKDGSTSVCCLLLPAMDLMESLCVDFKNGSTKRKKKALENIHVNDSDYWMFVSNTGDSRGILVTKDGQIREMSHDHKPNSVNERDRIQAKGGRVVFFGTWRVEGVLAVSRSFGDRLLKKWIIPDPEVIAHKVDECNDLFLILATDGVWDTVSNEEAAQVAIEVWNNPHQKDMTLNQRLRAIAQKITSFAYTRGSMDNITTLVVHLPSHCSN